MLPYQKKESSALIIWLFGFLDKAEMTFDLLDHIDDHYSKQGKNIMTSTYQSVLTKS